MAVNHKQQINAATEAVARRLSKWRGHRNPDAEIVLTSGRKTVVWKMYSRCARDLAKAALAATRLKEQLPYRKECSDNSAH